MGKLILESAVRALCDGGIPAQRGMPAGKMGQIADTVVAVNLDAMDMRNKKVRIRTTVLTPAALGAAACEEAALNAGQILTDLGGKCDVGRCRFDGRIGLFTVEIQGEFNSAVPKVLINETMLNHVLAFTSWRSLDEEVSDWHNAKWNFRLEEYFPMGEDQDADPAGEFTLVHISASGTETFLRATWTYQRRVWDASGVRQVRLGVAQETDVG